MGQKLKAKMDKARPLMNIGDTHEATDKHPALTGKGVIVGVVDGGIDYRHPSFYSADGETYRVKSVLEQSGDVETGEFTSVEYTTKEEILAKGFSDNTHDLSVGGHGTHVASIAAGSGYTNPKLQGVAYESDIVQVATFYSDDAVADGVAYVFSKATEAGKPAVVNLSIGSSALDNPESFADGNAIMAKMISEMVKDAPGHIVVAAASNEGDAFHAYSKGGGEELNLFIPLPIFQKNSARLLHFP